MRLTEFAARVGSKVLNLRDDFEVLGITTLDEAGPGQVSFIATPKYAAASSTTSAGALIIPASMDAPDRPSIPLDQPWRGVLFLLDHFFPDDRFIYFEGIHPTAFVDPTATIAPSVRVGPNAVIGPRVTIGDATIIGPGAIVGPDAHIGNDCMIHPAAVIGPESQIGDRVIIQAGAVIGADGFKYEKVDGKLAKIAQVGRVIIGDDAEVGANSCIDRASYTATRIGPGAKIDNLVQIAHNVELGQACIVVSQAGIAGSTKIGAGSIVAAQAGLIDHLTIGPRALIHAQAGVMKDLEPGAQVVGSPARPFRESMKIFAAWNRLPDMVREVSALERRIAALEAKLAEKP